MERSTGVTRRAYPGNQSDRENQKLEIGIAGGDGGDGPRRRRLLASPPGYPPASFQAVARRHRPFRGRRRGHFHDPEIGGTDGPRAAFGGGLAATTIGSYPVPIRVTWGGDRVVPLRDPPYGRRRGPIRNPRSMCQPHTKCFDFCPPQSKLCVNPDKAEPKGRRVYGKGKKKS